MPQDEIINELHSKVAEKNSAIAEKNSAIEHYKAWIRSDQQDHHPDEFL